MPDVSSRAALAEQLAAERCLAGRIPVAGLSKIFSADHRISAPLSNS
jgi:hypothetical protein